MWKSKPWRLYHIGDFFTDLALKIFGGEKTASSLDSGDINNWDLDTQIEIKGCSNRNCLKIYSRQLDTEVEQIGFPLSHLWYVIFFYRNQWADRSRSLSKETPTHKALNAFLNKNIMNAFAVDAKVLMAIRKINGIREEQRTNETVNIIRVNKTTLQCFVENPKHTFKHFKLRGFSVFKRRIHMKFRGSVIDFNLTLILPKKQLEKIFQLNLNFSYETPEISDAQESFL